MKKFLALIFAVLSSEAFAGTVSLQDIMNSKNNRITITPVEYNGKRVSASGANIAASTICKLAGYSIVLECFIEIVPRAQYADIWSIGDMALVQSSEATSVFKSIECAR